MFCPDKNSYLQLVCAMEPRLINRAVRKAMCKKQFDPHDEPPPAQRLESMQPSLFAPCVDVTRARLGFDRLGLRILNRELHSNDNFTKLRAIHTLLDQVRVSGNAMFLIKLNVVYRVIDLMTDRDPIIREKVAYILTHLGNFYQGRNRIMSRPVVIDNLILMFMRDRKEIRYAAALCLKTLTRDRCACETITKNTKIIESLLKSVKNDHMGIVILHLNSLKNLSEWDPVTPLKANAFQIMRKLLIFPRHRVVQAAMDCMMSLCKHSVGKKLADQYDMTKVLLSYLVCPHIEVVISAVGLMQYTTVTTQSKWRAKEFQYDLVDRLVTLAIAHNIPVLQLHAMQVLINLCDSPDIRANIKKNFERKIIQEIKITNHEQWAGTSEITTYGLETGHNYRTMCIEGVETIKNDHGDNANAINVNSYLMQVNHVKEHLIKAINFQPHIN